MVKKNVLFTPGTNGTNGHSHSLPRAEEVVPETLRGGRFPEELRDTTLPGYRTHWVPLRQIKDADHNAPDRVEGASADKAVDSLGESLEQEGQACNVLIRLLRSKNGKVSYRLIEGHRRKYAAIKNGWTHLLAVVIGPDCCNPAILFARINETCVRHKGYQKLYSYLSNPLSVSPYMRAAFRTMEGVIGRELCVELADNKKSLATYRWCCKFVEQASRCQSRAMIRRCVKWVLTKGSEARVRDAVEGKYPLGLVLSAVLQNKRICDQ